VKRCCIIFKEVDISHKETEPNSIEIDVDEAEFPIFTGVLAYYISRHVFKETMMKHLMKKSISEKDAKEITGSQLKDMEKSIYFDTLTRILLNEYFKKFNHVKLESFELFNLKGLTEELKVFAQNIIDFRHNEFDLDEYYEEQGAELGSQEVFNALRNNALEKGVNFDLFTTINVYGKNGRIIYENMSGEIVNEEFFIASLGGSLEFIIEQTVEDSDLLEDMLTLSVLFKVFDIEKIVIHKSVSKKAKDLILYNIELSVLNKENISIIDCDDCERCDK